MCTLLDPALDVKTFSVISNLWRQYEHRISNKVKPILLYFRSMGVTIHMNLLEESKTKKCFTPPFREKIFCLEMYGSD